MLANSADKNIDLRVRQKPAGFLRKSGHRGSTYALCSDAADRCVIGYGEIRGSADPHGHCALSIDAVTRGAVLTIERAEIGDFAGANNGRLNMPAALPVPGCNSQQGYDCKYAVLHRVRSS